MPEDQRLWPFRENGAKLRVPLFKRWNPSQSKFSGLDRLIRLAEEDGGWDKVYYSRLSDSEKGTIRQIVRGLPARDQQAIQANIQTLGENRELARVFLCEYDKAYADAHKAATRDWDSSDFRWFSDFVVVRTNLVNATQYPRKNERE